MAKNHYENIPLKIKQEIGNYAAIHGTKTAINHFSKIYLKFPLKRTTLNSWKETLVDDKMLQKIRDVRCYNRITFSVNSIVIGTGVMKANKPKS